MKKVVITGANGFIGKQVTDYLSNQGFDVYPIIRPGSIPRFNLKHNVHVVVGDLTNQKSLESIPDEAEVINLAANPYHPKLSYEVNVLGTLKLVNVCKQRKVIRIIHISSQATKILRKGVYATTKEKSDHIVMESGIPYVILKPSLVYGPDERGLFNKIKQLADKLPAIPVFGDGQTELHPIHVEDFSKLIELILNNPRDCQTTYDVGCREPVTYERLYHAIAGKDNVKLLHIPVWIGLLVAKLTSFIKNPPFVKDNILGSTQSTHCDPGPILKKYSFVPREFDVGIASFNGEQKKKIAIIGLGKMGTLHATILNTFPNIKIAALVDTNKALYSTIRSMGIDAPFFTSLEEMLSQVKIDAAYITTPTFTHYQLLEKLIKKNISTFIEKPLTLKAEEIEKLSHLKNLPVIAVGYTLLFNRVFQEVKKIIQSQKYGRIISFNGRFEHGEVFGPKKGWMFNKNLSGGGVLMNPGPHFFSLINLFFGKPKKISGSIKNIYSSSNLDDQAEIKFQYPQFTGTAFISWSVPHKPIATTTFSIQFEKAVVKADGKVLQIKPNQGKPITVKYSDIKPTVYPVYNVNPEANGEAYVIESTKFIENIDAREYQNINSVSFSLATEAIIYDCYRKCEIIHGH